MNLLTKKYNTDFAEEPAVAGKEQADAAGTNSQHAIENQGSGSSDGDNINDDEELSDSDLLESKARGRHQSEAATLRISKIEKILSKRTDLTRQQRRKLQSRKNTANFRERQRNSNKLKVFLTYELDAIINAVST